MTTNDARVIIVGSPKECPLRLSSGLCFYLDKDNPSPDTFDFCPNDSTFPSHCRLKKITDCPDCGNCDGSCQKGDSEPVLTTDEEIDQLIIAIKALEKRFWTSENRIRCVRAAALLEDIDLDKEVNPE